MSTRLRWLTALLATFTLLAGACGSDGGTTAAPAARRIAFFPALFACFLSFPRFPTALHRLHLDVSVHFMQAVENERGGQLDAS